MEQFETRSTSSHTAECTPVVLRESDRVRLVFVPTLVNNPTQPNAAVRGHFVYQRKSRKAEWEPVPTVPLSSLKSGEGYKLELHSEELFAIADPWAALQTAPAAGHPTRKEYVRK